MMSLLFDRLQSRLGKTSVYLSLFWLLMAVDITPSNARGVPVHNIQASYLYAYHANTQIDPTNHTQAQSGTTHTHKTSTIHAEQSNVEQFNQTFQELLLSDSYSDSEQTKHWQPKNKKEADFDVPDMDWGFLDFWQNIGQGVGVLGKVLLLLLLVTLLYWIFRHKDAVAAFIGGYLPRQNASVMSYSQAEQRLVFADLPAHEQLFDAIGQLLVQGRYLQALSWLYQGSLRVMSLTYQLPITASQTEEQCQALLKASLQSSADEQQFFEQLVAVWQEAAYGKRLPTNSKARLTLLLDTWGQLYCNQGGNHG